MNVPKEVINSASHLTQPYNCGIKHLGKYRGDEAFIADLPDDVTVGFPEVYLFRAGHVKVIGAPLSFSIIDSFVEDAGELGVE